MKTKVMCYNIKKVFCRRIDYFELAFNLPSNQIFGFSIDLCSGNIEN